MVLGNRAVTLDHRDEVPVVVGPVEGAEAAQDGAHDCGGVLHVEADDLLGDAAGGEGLEGAVSSKVPIEDTHGGLIALQGADRATDDTGLARLALDFSGVLPILAFPSIHQALRHHLQPRAPDKRVTARAALVLVKARDLVPLAPRVRPDTRQDLLSGADRRGRRGHALAPRDTASLGVRNGRLISSARGQRGQGVRLAVMAQGGIAEVPHHAGDAARRGVVGWNLLVRASADGAEGGEAFGQAGNEFVAGGAVAVVDGLLAVWAGEEGVVVAGVAAVWAAADDFGELVWLAGRQLGEGAGGGQVGLAVRAAVRESGHRSIRAHGQRRDIASDTRVRQARRTTVSVCRDSAYGALGERLDIAANEIE